MSILKSYGFENNKKFDLERLRHEIKASPLPKMVNGQFVNPSVYNGYVWVVFSEPLDSAQETQLQTIITDHNGDLKSRTSQDLQDKRENVLSELVDLAHNHPVLKTMPDEITSYLTSIDNWFNAWKRDGNHTQLVAKIVADAGDSSHPNHTFLNTQVDTEGSMTWQFIVSYIPDTPYI